MENLDLIVTKEACADRLEEIARYFTPDCHITLIVRKPGNDEADFVLSTDCLVDADRVLVRRIQAGQV